MAHQVRKHKSGEFLLEVDFKSIWNGRWKIRYFDGRIEKMEYDPIYENLAKLLRLEKPNLLFFPDMDLYFGVDEYKLEMEIIKGVSKYVGILVGRSVHIKRKMEDGKK